MSRHSEEQPHRAEAFEGLREGVVPFSPDKARRAAFRGGGLPSFLILGAQRSASTSLFDAICRHPEVGQPIQKEVHFFDRSFDLGIDWYRSRFPAPEKDRPFISGEATPFYLFHPLVPGRVADTLPSCKFLVMLRDPVDRALSQYRLNRAQGDEDVTFARAIELEPTRLAQDVGRLDAPPHRSFAFENQGYLARGRYRVQLERWVARFDPGRILLLFFESLIRDPGAHLETIFDFLGVTPAPISFPRLNSARGPDQDPALLEQLRHQSREENLSLGHWIRATGFRRAPTPLPAWITEGAEPGPRP